MAVDSGLRVLAEQHTQELQQGSFLCVGAGVFGFAVSGQPADVAHAYAVAVVSRAVCACLVLGATTLDSAVEVDDIVVADTTKATLTVPTVDVGGVVVRSLTRGGAVDDDFGDGVHKYIVFCQLGNYLLDGVVFVQNVAMTIMSEIS